MTKNLLPLQRIRGTTNELDLCCRNLQRPGKTMNMHYLIPDFVSMLNLATMLLSFLLVTLVSMKLRFAKVDF